MSADLSALAREYLGDGSPRPLGALHRLAAERGVDPDALTRAVGFELDLRRGLALARRRTRRCVPLVARGKSIVSPA